jgi:hypothetical protein
MSADDIDAAFERAVELDDERDDREARRSPEVLHEAEEFFLAPVLEDDVV